MDKCSDDSHAALVLGRIFDRCSANGISGIAGPRDPHIWPKLSTTLLAGLGVIGSDVALSHANTVATKQTAAHAVGARSPNTKSSGKYYYEVTLTQTSGANDTVGVIRSNGTYSQMVDSGTFSTQVTKWSGNIFSNDVNTGKSLGPLVSGDTIGVAADLSARKAWLRKNSGQWNGDATANPNTGVGGLQIDPMGSFGPALAFGGTGTMAGDTITVNFGEVNFNYANPIGFSKWMV